ncbi:Acg family FMN-binding oxidoreductase [Actinokineospora globicatena]|uniref:Acg family FMN-binding oxidoreductase n=1 Tax=Actinokineospora globicatena TaxID=103729 RepID=UPI0020A329AC|nr:nitroreductase family protein [Actinokineospora globicatena]MCP2306142.1 Nitroreductase family protein [Actinokineospora globicatena]GLW79983.1 NAD(P)H nitroreductase [Actinokineospora globicatena]GLW86812.1 NAD(P)H nitroreductase [Actinokineospora globicatena]
MTRTRPDHETVLDALALACRAPSVHNTQPWRWLVGDRSVHLMADPQRRVPATDPDGRDLLISCGGALHHLEVALAAFGWRAVTHLLPNPAEPEHLAAVQAYPHHTDAEDIALVTALDDRRTDRRAYSSWAVPTGHLDLMARRAADFGVVAVPVTDPVERHQFARAAASAAREQEADPAYTSELAFWAGRGRSTEEGVPAGAIPARTVDVEGVPMRAFPAGSLAPSPTGEHEQDASVLLVLGTTDDDETARLRAGQAASAVLLTATELGLATCPMSQPLEVPRHRERIRDRFLDGVGHAQLVVRVGYAPTSAPAVPQSPRRPLADVFAYLPGMAPARPRAAGHRPG